MGDDQLAVGQRFEGLKAGIHRQSDGLDLAAPFYLQPVGAVRVGDLFNRQLLIQEGDDVIS
jgi:hypothetical protein